eukprot:TRINITY_DN13245_c0_g1_i2.p2 TRINITY_DN13245_c0_g1~~TRINITY_DN13245_c0_g1_i2.p2  ORF type:complete len:175 (+),score=29.02 TRINITY_DN13245_c0_g1_i2:64-588(+)
MPAIQAPCDIFCNGPSEKHDQGRFDALFGLLAPAFDFFLIRYLATSFGDELFFRVHLSLLKLSKSLSTRLRLGAGLLKLSKSLSTRLRLGAGLLKLSKSLSTRLCLGAGVGCGQKRFAVSPNSFKTCAEIARPAAAGCMPRTGMTRRRKLATLPNSAGGSGWSGSWSGRVCVSI